MTDAMPAHAATSLKALRLRPGMSLQARPVGETGSPLELRFFAAIEDKGLMAVPTVEGDIRRQLQPGVPYRLGGFTGTHDFHFQSRVLQFHAMPFVYALFAYPGEVMARQVRVSLRIPTSLPALAYSEAASIAVPVRVVDLSQCGAMMWAPGPLGAVGKGVRLSLELDVDGRTESLALDATICHSGKGDGGEGHRIGIGFRGIGRDQRLLLKLYTQEGTERLFAAA